METSDGQADVFALLEEAVCSDPDVVFVVAFGSRITGEARTDSDLDVAVKFGSHLTASERFEKQCFLSGEVQTEAAPFVDLSDIETLSLDVAHDAVDGRFVCGDDSAFEQFKTDVEATFLEQRRELRHHHRSVIDRIAEEGLRG